MTYDEAKAKAKAGKLVKGESSYNFAQSEMMRDKVIGQTFVTRSGKVVEVVEHTSYNNIIIKANGEYDAVAGVWFIAHIERGSFERK